MAVDEVNASEIIRQFTNFEINQDLHSRLIELENKREVLLENLSLVSSEARTKLNVARLGSSNTLGRDPIQLANWDRANEQVNTWIAQDRPLTLSAIFQLHSILTTGTLTQVSLRDHAVFTGGHEHLSTVHLPELMLWLEDALRTPHSNSIVFASLVRYWLVSIHPFRDGNGRTSTLVADWILLRAGYPPFCFPRIGDGTVAFTPEGKAWATPERAILKSCEGLMTSFEIFQT